MDLCANEWKEIEKLEKKNKKLTNALILRNDELLKARDALRWRKYPEEKPESGKHIIVRQHGLIFVALPEGERGKKARSYGSFVWLPIPLEEQSS